MRKVFHAVTSSRLNVLLIALPISWWLAAATEPSLWLFATAAITLIPAAGMIGHATEELAARAGPTLGGFLNATFGNAAELIIAGIALYEQHIEVVKASLTGSIIGNLLLVFGLSALLGGSRHEKQRFDRTAAGASVVMLFLALVALLMPAVVDLAIFGSLAAHPPVIDRLSLAASIVLILVYAAGLVFSFRARRDPLRPIEARPHAHPSALDTRSAVALLVLFTMVTALQAELLISGLEPALASLGMTELFAGVIVIAIVGNAAEHYSAITAARDNEMILSFEIAVGSSTQIALLVAPVLVLMSYAFGAPMSLVFNAFELTALGVSVGAIALVAADGETNWFEGLQLVAVYLILGIAFYLIPGT